MAIMLTGTQCVQYEDSLSFVELSSDDVVNLRVYDGQLFIMHDCSLYHIKNLVWDQDMSFLPDEVLNSQAVRETVNPHRALVIRAALLNACCPDLPEYEW